MSEQVRSMASLEARIDELEVQLNRFKLGPGVAAFSAGDCTNGCTDGCTRGCTNGCTGTGCLVEVPGIDEVISPAGNIAEGNPASGGRG